MGHGSGSEMDALLSEQAAGWFVRLVANDLSLSERREYLAWLRASERHVEALLDICRYHGYVRKTKLQMGASLGPHPGANVIPFALRGGTPDRRNRELRRPQVLLFKVAGALVGITFTAFVGWTVKASYFDQRISTGPGEWDSTLLSDGSVLRIGPNTRLHWSFDEERRVVELKRGEAVFEVAKDPRRPFVVTTSIGDVRAVGTEFGVSLTNASTAVVTVEGCRDRRSRQGRAQQAAQRALRR